MPEQKIKLDIISDPICPWCYIGKANLDRALAAHPYHPFEIEWHPFQLNPQMPKEGMGRREYLEQKFGGKEAAVTAYLPVIEHAQKLELDLHLEEMKRTPNTINAHRLIHWAGIEGRQTAAVSALFHAYFVNAQDIGDENVILEIADRIEMDRNLVSRLLKTDEDVDLIIERDKHSRQKGVASVPTFIVANQHVVQGAQPAALWENVIEELLIQNQN